MNEQYKRFDPRRLLKENTPLSEHEQERLVFKDIYTTLVSQGKEILRRDIRNSWKGTDCIIQQPIRDEDGQIRRLLPTPLTVQEGTIMLWKGLPTALAYGTIPHSDHFVLLGTTHYQQTLDQNRINPRTTDTPEVLLGEFPGYFLRNVDAQSFFITSVHKGKDIGVKTGGRRPDSQRTQVFAMADFRDRSRKKGKLAEIAGFIATEMQKKFEQRYPSY